jgi:hypothetical protein
MGQKRKASEALTSGANREKVRPAKKERSDRANGHRKQSDEAGKPRLVWFKSCPTRWPVANGDIVDIQTKT